MEKRPNKNIKGDEYKEDSLSSDEDTMNETRQSTQRATSGTINY